MSKLREGDMIYTIDCKLENDKLTPVVYRNKILKTTAQLYITERSDGIPVMVLLDCQLAINKSQLPLHCVEEEDIPSIVQGTLKIMDERFEYRFNVLSDYLSTLLRRKSFFTDELVNPLFSSYKKLTPETVGLFIFDICDGNLIKARLLTDSNRKIGSHYLVSHQVFADKAYSFEEKDFNTMFQIEYDDRYCFCIPLKLSNPILMRVAQNLITEAIGEIVEDYQYEILDIKEQRYHFNMIHENPNIQHYD